MKRKKMIKIAKRYKKEGYKLHGEEGIFKALAMFTGKSPKTIQSYYYADKSRPKNKV